jgi:hypothetical protein
VAMVYAREPRTLLTALKIAHRLAATAYALVARRQRTAAGTAPCAAMAYARNGKTPSPAPRTALSVVAIMYVREPRTQQTALRIARSVVATVYAREPKTLLTVRRSARSAVVTALVLELRRWRTAQMTAVSAVMACAQVLRMQ